MSKETRKERAKILPSSEDEGDDFDINSAPQMSESSQSDSVKSSKESTPKKKKLEISPWEQLPKKKSQVTPKKSKFSDTGNPRSTPRKRGKTISFHEDNGSGCLGSDKQKKTAIQANNTVSSNEGSAVMNEILRYLRNINFEVKELKTALDELRSSISELKPGQFSQVITEEDVLCDLNLPFSDENSLQSFEEMLRADADLKKKLVSYIHNRL